MSVTFTQSDAYAPAQFSADGGETWHDVGSVVFTDEQKRKIQEAVRVSTRPIEFSMSFKPAWSISELRLD